MSNNCQLSNKELSKLFKKYLKLKWKPLGMYFVSILPEGQKRFQHKLLNRCMVKHIFKAAKFGGSSIISAERGCIGGQWWSGFRQRAPKGLTSFLTKGREGVFGGRGERFKKNVQLAGKYFKDPGRVKQPEGSNYIVYQALEKIPPEVQIEFLLFFANPLTMTKIIQLCNYAIHKLDLVRAPAGSGCMSILNFPLQLKPEPEPDAVLGFWDLFARRRLPKNLLTLAIRPWFAKSIAKDIPESFLAHPTPYTLKGEVQLLIRKLKRK